MLNIFKENKKLNKELEYYKNKYDEELKKCRFIESINKDLSFQLKELRTNKVRNI